MKKNKVNTLLALAALIAFALACNSAGGGSVNENSAPNGGNAANNGAADLPKTAPAECPARTLSVGEAKSGGLQKYEGCKLSVRGKIWDMQSTTVELFDAAERTNYNGSIYVGGNFTGSTYSEVSMKLLKLRTDQKYDLLPIATFTGTVKTVSGYSNLHESVLSDFQK
jgi:hypothetical protein